MITTDDLFQWWLDELVRLDRAPSPLILASLEAVGSHYGMDMCTELGAQQLLAEDPEIQILKASRIAEGSRVEFSLSGEEFEGIAEDWMRNPLDRNDPLIQLDVHGTTTILPQSELTLTGRQSGVGDPFHRGGDMLPDVYVVVEKSGITSSAYQGVGQRKKALENWELDLSRRVSELAEFEFAEPLTADARARDSHIVEARRARLLELNRDLLSAKIIKRLIEDNLLASSGVLTPLVAARRPHINLPNVPGSYWDPAMHPRGKDGKFIETNGWVNWSDMRSRRQKRGQVKFLTRDQQGGSWINVQPVDNFGRPIGPEEKHRAGELSSAPTPKADLKSVLAPRRPGRPITARDEEEGAPDWLTQPSDEERQERRLNTDARLVKTIADQVFGIDVEDIDDDPIDDERDGFDDELDEAMGATSTPEVAQKFVQSMTMKEMQKALRKNTVTKQQFIDWNENRLESKKGRGGRVRPGWSRDTSQAYREGGRSRPASWSLERPQEQEEPGPAVPEPRMGEPPEAPPAEPEAPEPGFVDLEDVRRRFEAEQQARDDWEQENPGQAMPRMGEPAEAAPAAPEEVTEEPELAEEIPEAEPEAAAPEVLEPEAPEEIPEAEVEAEPEAAGEVDPLERARDAAAAWARPAPGSPDIMEDYPEIANEQEYVGFALETYLQGLENDDNEMALESLTEARAARDRLREIKADIQEAIDSGSTTPERYRWRDPRFDQTTEWFDDEIARLEAEPGGPVSDPTRFIENRVDPDVDLEGAIAQSDEQLEGILAEVRELERRDDEIRDSGEMPTHEQSMELYDARHRLEVEDAVRRELEARKRQATPPMFGPEGELNEPESAAPEAEAVDVLAEAEDEMNRLREEWIHQSDLAHQQQTRSQEERSLRAHREWRRSKQRYEDLVAAQAAEQSDQQLVEVLDLPEDATHEQVLQALVERALAGDTDSINQMYQRLVESRWQDLDARRSQNIDLNTGEGAWDGELVRGNNGQFLAYAMPRGAEFGNMELESFDDEDKARDWLSGRLAEHRLPWLSGVSREPELFDEMPEAVPEPTPEAGVPEVPGAPEVPEAPAAPEAPGEESPFIRQANFWEQIGPDVTRWAGPNDWGNFQVSTGEDGNPYLKFFGDGWTPTYVDRTEDDDGNVYWRTTQAFEPGDTEAQDRPYWGGESTKYHPRPLDAVRDARARNGRDTFTPGGDADAGDISLWNTGATPSTREPKPERPWTEQELEEGFENTPRNPRPIPGQLPASPRDVRTGGNAEPDTRTAEEVDATRQAREQGIAAAKGSVAEDGSEGRWRLYDLQDDQLDEHEWATRMRYAPPQGSEQFTGTVFQDPNTGKWQGQWTTKRGKTGTNQRSVKQFDTPEEAINYVKTGVDKKVAQEAAKRTPVVRRERTPTPAPQPTPTGAEPEIPLEEGEIGVRTAPPPVYEPRSIVDGVVWDDGAIDVVKSPRYAFHAYSDEDHRSLDRRQREDTEFVIKAMPASAEWYEKVIGDTSDRWDAAGIRMPGVVTNMNFTQQSRQDPNGGNHVMFSWTDTAALGLQRTTRPLTVSNMSIATGRPKETYHNNLIGERIVITTHEMGHMVDHALYYKKRKQQGRSTRYTGGSGGVFGGEEDFKTEWTQAINNYFAGEDEWIAGLHQTIDDHYDDPLAAEVMHAWIDLPETRLMHDRIPFSMDYVAKPSEIWARGMPALLERRLRRRGHTEDADMVRDSYLGRKVPGVSDGQFQEYIGFGGHLGNLDSPTSTRYLDAYEAYLAAQGLLDDTDQVAPAAPAAV